MKHRQDSDFQKMRRTIYSRRHNLRQLLMAPREVVLLHAHHVHHRQKHPAHHRAQRELDVPAGVEFAVGVAIT